MTSSATWRGEMLKTVGSPPAQTRIVTQIWSRLASQLAHVATSSTTLEEMEERPGR
eukprot:SAG11_NODE_15911_length_563_cov_0.663793_1_plen_55_part_01